MTFKAMHFRHERAWNHVGCLCSQIGCEFCVCVLVLVSKFCVNRFGKAAVLELLWCIVVYHFPDSVSIKCCLALFWCVCLCLLAFFTFFRCVIDLLARFMDIRSIFRIESNLCKCFLCKNVSISSVLACLYGSNQNKNMSHTKYACIQEHAYGWLCRCDSFVGVQFSIFSAFPLKLRMVRAQQTQIHTYSSVPRIHRTCIHSESFASIHRDAF